MRTAAMESSLHLRGERWCHAPTAQRGRHGDTANVQGTIVCGVVESEAGRDAADLAAALAARLDLRLVLVHVLSDEAGVRPTRMYGDAELRVVTGSRAGGLARIAAEEGADAIVIGARRRGSRGRNLCCSLAHDLDAATTVPVLIAPPATRRRSHRRLTVAAAAGER